MQLARKQADLHQRQAAAALDITPEYLSMIENGHNQPSGSLVSRIADLYGVTIATFLRNTVEVKR